MKRSMLPVRWISSVRVGVRASGLGVERDEIAIGEHPVAGILEAEPGLAGAVDGIGAIDVDARAERHLRRVGRDRASTVVHAAHRACRSGRLDP